MDQFSLSSPLFLSAYRTSWQQISEDLSKLHASQIPQYLYTHLQAEGLETTLLSEDNQCVGLSCTLPASIPYTLLLATTYDASNPSLQNSPFIIACLIIFRMYFEHLRLPPITIKWLLLEEQMLQQKRLISLQTIHPATLQANSCFWYDANLHTKAGLQHAYPLLASGTKGLLQVLCTAHTSNQTLSSSYGTIAQNAAWRLLWALTRLKNATEDILVDGFYDQIDAFEDSVLTDLDYLATKTQPYLNQAQLLSGLQKHQSYYAHFLTPTCTINTIATETNETTSTLVIPGQASALVDFHLVPNQQPDDIMRLLQLHLTAQGFHDIQLQPQICYAPTFTSNRTLFVQALKRSIQTAYQCPPLLIPLLPTPLPLTMLHTPLVLFAPPNDFAHHDNPLALVTQIILSIDEIAGTLKLS